MGLTRRNIDALEKAGNHVADLEEQLQAARLERGKLIVACYQQGWTWDELVRTGRTSIGSVRKYVAEAGVLRPTKGRTDLGRARKAAQRASFSDAPPAEAEP
jgi:hypothetical protein